MSHNPPVASVMTTAPQAIGLDASLREAEDRMIDHEIRHLPVVDGAQLVGVVSDRDIAFASGDAGGLGDRMRVRDVCSLDVYAVEPGTPLAVVVEQMAERRIGSAVVTDGGKIVGLFTATDACRCLARFLRGEGDAA